MAIHYLSSIDSTATWSAPVHKNVLASNVGTATTETHTLASRATSVVGWTWTGVESGITAWPDSTGTNYSAQLNVATGNANLSVVAAVARISSDGVTVLQTFQPNAFTPGTGLIPITFPAGAWSVVNHSTHRLGLRLTVSNSAMSSQAWTLNLGVNDATLTAPFAPPLPPNPPTSLTATGTVAGVDLAWTAPTTGTTPTSYKINRSHTGNVVPTVERTFSTGIGRWRADNTAQATASWGGSNNQVMALTVIASSGADPIARLGNGADSLAVTPGTTYSIQARVRNTAATTGRNAAIHMSWFNSAGTFISNTFGSGIGLSTTFTQINQQHTAPANAAFGSPFIGHGGWAVGDVYEYDDFSIPIAVATTFTSTATTYSDTATESGTTYTYTVRSIASGLESADSNSVTGTRLALNPPTGLTATGDADSINLAWTAPASGTAPTSYNVRRVLPALSGDNTTFTGGIGGWTAGADTTVSHDIAAGALKVAVINSDYIHSAHSPILPITGSTLLVSTTLSDSTVSGGSSVRVEVSFYDSNGSIISTTNLYTVSLLGQTDIRSITTSIPASASQARLNIVAFEAGKAGFGNYFLVHDAQFGPLLTATVTAPTVSYEDSAADLGSTYIYTVRSFASGAESTDSNSVTGTLASASNPPTTAPVVSGSAVSGTQINLSWTNVAEATSYDVERNSVITQVGLTGTTHDSTGLSPSTSYSYRVRGKNSSGDGPWSDPFVISTLSSPQIVYPVADGASVGAWTREPGAFTTDLWQAIDEPSTADTSDYVQSPLGAAATDFYRARFNSMGVPAARTGHIFTLRHGKDSTGGQSLSLAITLVQGDGTQIASRSLSNADMETTDRTDVFTLTEAEANLITDYSDLRLEVNPTFGGGQKRSYRLYWAQMEAPPAAPILNPPTGLKAVGDADSISLAWAAPASGAAPTSYSVRRNGLQIGTATTTAYSDSTAVSGTIYTYTVRSTYLGSESVDGNSATSTIYTPTDYSNEIMSDSPVAYWRLDEISGTIAVDRAGGDHTATYVGNPTLGSPGLTNDLSAGVQLDGTGSQYLTVPSSLSTATPDNAITVEAWVKFDSIPPVDPVNNAPAIITEHYDSGIGDNTVRFAMGILYGTGRLYAGFYDGTAWRAAEYTGTVPVNTVLHLVGTYDGSVIRFYLNGVESATLNHVASLPASSSTVGWYIGKRWDYNETIDGVIDEVAVYDTVLSPARVVSHYTAGTSLKISSLSDDFNDGTPDTSKWVYGTNTAEVNGELSKWDAGVTKAIDSVNWYDLTESSAFVKVRRATGGYVDVSLTGDGSGYAWFMIRGNVASVSPNYLSFETAAGRVDIAPYDSVAHAWLRLRHDGTNLHAETSPDGLTWTVRTSVAHAAWMSKVKPSIWAGENSSSNLTYFDNFNVVPSGGPVFPWKGPGIRVWRGVGQDLFIGPT